MPGDYAPEPKLILDTVVKLLAHGRFKAKIGGRESLQDNTFIGKLVHAEILSADQLGPTGKANGKAYFISDYALQNTLVFLRPIVEGLGEASPEQSIPAGLIRPLLTLWETLHFRLGLRAPLLSPQELGKVSVTHNGRIADAQRGLGYQPVTPSPEATAQYLTYCWRRYADIKTGR